MKAILKHLNRYKKISFYFLHHETTILCIVFFLVALLCISYALRLYNCISCEYSVFDGSFQTYNGLRRMFAGETPFKDFYFYLGLGPLYALTVFTFPWKSDYVSVMLAINGIIAFLAFLSFFIISYLTTKKKSLSAYIALLLLYAALHFISPWHALAVPGNSLRPLRFFIVPLTALLLPMIVKKYKGIPCCLLIGLLAGLSCAWSSDFGICGAIACFFYVSLHGKFKFFLPRLIFTLFSSILCTYCIVSILTRGNFSEWVNYIFINVPQYQNWLFTINTYPFEITGFLHLFRYRYFWCGVFFLVLCLIPHLPFLNKKYPFRFLSFMGRQKDLLVPALTVFGAVIGYALFNTWELFFFFKIFFLLWIISLLARNLYVSCKRLRKVYCFALPFLMIAIFLCCVNTYREIASSAKWVQNQQKDRISYNGLGKVGGGIAKVAAGAVKMPRNAKIWEYYSAVVSSVNNQLNPTGFDYIIHALGDQYRKKYMTVFQDTKPDYVTIPSHGSYSFWAANMFWAFTREVLSQYRFVDKGIQNYYCFERSASPIDFPQYKISEEVIHCNQYIIIKLRSSGKNHLVDCNISYTVTPVFMAVNPHIYILQRCPWKNRQHTSISAPGKAENFSFAAIIDENGNGNIRLKTDQKRIHLTKIVFGKCFSNEPWSSFQSQDKQN